MLDMMENIFSKWHDIFSRKDNVLLVGIHFDLVFDEFRNTQSETFLMHEDPR
jgi:hypothetical protein